MCAASVRGWKLSDPKGLNTQSSQDRFLLSPWLGHMDNHPFLAYGPWTPTLATSVLAGEGFAVDCQVLLVSSGQEEFLIKQAMRQPKSHPSCVWSAAAWSPESCPSLQFYYLPNTHTHVLLIFLPRGCKKYAYWSLCKKASAPPGCQLTA